MVKPKALLITNIPSSRRKLTSRKSVAIVALIALVIDALIVRSLILLAPYIRSAFEIDASQIGTVMASLMTGTLLTTLPLGNILGRLNTRWTFGTIMTVIGIGLFVVGSQNTFYGLIATLFIVGILRSGIVPLTNRLIAENFDNDQRGSITGFIFAAIPMGGFLEALVLPILGETFDWGAGYRLLGTMALFGGIYTWIWFPKEKTAFPVNQAKLQSRSLRSRTFIILAVTYGLFALSMTTEAFVTLFLVDVVKISALIAGTFFGLIQLSGVVGRIFWGFLADRYFSKNRWWLLAFISGLMVITLALLIRINPYSPYWFIAIAMVGFGISAASSWVILCTLVGDVVGISMVAAATAIIYFITNIVDTGGPGLFSKLLKLTQSYQCTFRIYIAIGVFTMLTFIWMALRNRLPINSEPL